MITAFWVQVRKQRPKAGRGFQRQQEPSRRGVARIRPWGVGEEQRKAGPWRKGALREEKLRRGAGRSGWWEIKAACERWSLSPGSTDASGGQAGAEDEWSLLGRVGDTGQGPARAQT